MTIPPKEPPQSGQDASGITAFPVRQQRALPHTEIVRPSLAGSPDWDDLRVLLCVVHEGSFGKAAKELNLTQPTVSRRVARLEALVGSQLIERTNNGATLTFAGQQVIEELHKAHGAIDRIVNRARSRAPRSEPLTLVTTDGIATYWISYFMQFLLDSHPEVELRMIANTDSSFHERHASDLIIHFMQPNDPNLLTVRLGSLHFTPFASPRYLERYGRPRTAEDLAHHRLLDYSLYLIDKGSWLSRLPNMVHEARAQVFTNSSASLAELVRNGAGIALLPTYGLVFEKGFESIDVGIKFATPFWLCYPKEALEKHGVRVTINFLKHIFNRRTMPWFSEQFVRPEEFPLVTPSDIMASFSPLNVVAFNP